MNRLVSGNRQNAEEDIVAVSLHSNEDDESESKSEIRSQNRISDDEEDALGDEEGARQATRENFSANAPRVVKQEQMYVQQEPIEVHEGNMTDKNENLSDSPEVRARTVGA